MVKWVVGGQLFVAPTVFGGLVLMHGKRHMSDRIL